MRDRVWALINDGAYNEESRMIGNGFDDPESLRIIDSPRVPDADIPLPEG